MRYKEISREGKKFPLVIYEQEDGSFTKRLTFISTLKSVSITEIYNGVKDNNEQRLDLYDLEFINKTIRKLGWLNE